MPGAIGCGASPDVPCLWKARVLEHRSASVSKTRLSRDVATSHTPLAQRGNRSFYWQIDVIHTDLMKAMTTQWGWHYRKSLKKDSWIRRAGIGWCQLKDFHVLRGEALCFHNVKLHKE
ncbi:MAG: hypothetical protein F6K50_13280 [Moorea sp. SIO3I7]|uniref:hypothetical protein n=1 Tax=Moorena sp. SIO3I8 TaxID=2607833 RepID=UPI0013C21BF1|nr:hypothetical protein [Moorena sp. SIO3I8]NEN96472.1 hypothetical protein [Moorena sp. SIO3I7]NEO08232.1 hypothetical protein [Moorena sp. SIO3I8]